jgi:Ca2+-binding RTX toxin-like protein
MRSQIQPLEPRRHFAVTASLVSGVLTINGTSGKDIVVLTTGSVGGRPILNVKDNQTDTTKSFRSLDVKSITVNFGAGDDYFTAGELVKQSIKLNGGTGNDAMRGGGGKDSLYGQDGNDTLYASKGNDIYAGDAGTDTVDYNGPTAVRVSLDNLANDGPVGAYDQVLNSVENINGGAGDDTLKGTAGSNVIHGNGGNDTIWGDYKYLDYAEMGGVQSGLKADTLHGDAGNDFIYASADNTLVFAGAGNDVASADNGVDVWRATVYGESGNDVIDLYYGAMYGGADSDTLTARGGGSKSQTYVTVDGGSGSDLIRSYFGKNVVTGGSGKDTIYVSSLDVLYAKDNEIDTLYRPFGSTPNLTISKDANDIVKTY